MLPIANNTKEIFGSHAMPEETIQFDPDDKRPIVHENLTQEQIVEVVKASMLTEEEASMQAEEICVEQERPRISMAEKLQAINTVLDFLWEEDCQETERHLRRLHDSIW